MQSENLSSKSMHTEKWIVCRACLKQPNKELVMHNIFNEDDAHDLTKLMLECGGVPIKKFDHYPDKICDKCLKNLRVAHRFRLTCQRSYQHLSRFMAPVVIDNNQTLQSSDNHSYMLVEDDEEFALKEEPTDEIRVKLEALEQADDEVIEIYEPMNDEQEEQEDAETLHYEMDDLEILAAGDSANMLAMNEFEYDDTVHTTDEEYLPNDAVILPIVKKEGKTTTITTAAVTRTNEQETTAAQQADEQQQEQHQQEDTSTANVVTRAKIKTLRSNGAVTFVKQPLKRGPKPRQKRATSYICDICGNIYPSQGRLTEHIKLHLGIKPHKCEICGYAFSQTQQLDRHMNTHTGNRPYKCKYCPAAFADLSTRNKHHRIHTNERPYVCDVCGKAFTYTNTLKFHKMIHTGEKPFVCHICGKGFQQNYKLRNHKMTHEKKAIKAEIAGVLENIESFDPNTAAITQILEI